MQTNNMLNTCTYMKLTSNVYLFVYKCILHISFRLRSEMCNFNIEFGYKAEHESYFRRPLGCMTDSPTFSFCNHDQTSGIC
jgi:hypothetical protein